MASTLLPQGTLQPSAFGPTGGFSKMWRPTYAACGLWRMREWLLPSPHLRFPFGMQPWGWHQASGLQLRVRTVRWQWLCAGRTFLWSLDADFYSFVA